MKVGEMCSRGIVSAYESASLREVASLMAQRRVGSVVVVAGPDAPLRPIGLITDRDIVRAQLVHVADLGRLRVADVMTKPVLTVSVDDELATAVELMRARGVRRAPVVNTRGELVGFVSTDDLVAELSRQLATLAALLRQQPAHEKRNV